jgi:hypothetical protein
VPIGVREVTRRTRGSSFNGLIWRSQRSSSPVTIRAVDSDHGRAETVRAGVDDA